LLDNAQTLAGIYLVKSSSCTHDGRAGRRHLATWHRRCDPRPHSFAELEI